MDTTKEQDNWTHDAFDVHPLSYAGQAASPPQAVPVAQASPQPTQSASIAQAAPPPSGAAAAQAPAAQAAPPSQLAQAGPPAQAPTAAQPGPTVQAANAPGTVTRGDAKAALTLYFQKVLSDSGRQTLSVTEAMRTAIRRIAVTADGQPDPKLALALMDVLNDKILPGTPDGLADLVAKHLPDTMPASAIAHLPAAKTKDAKDGSPTSVGDAVGKGLADQLAPGLKKLPLSPDLQTKLLELARTGGAEGLSKGVEKIIGAVPLDPKVKAALTALIQAALKQGGSPPDLQADGKGSPDHLDPPPGHQFDPGPSPKGEVIITSPAIPWDFPSPKPPPKVQAPQEPAAADDKAVAKAIAGIDANALAPASLRGKPEADGYPEAREFARALAEEIAKAQKARRTSVTMQPLQPYPTAEDQGAAIDALMAITATIGGAMPNHGSPVQEVVVQITSRTPGTNAWQRKVKLGAP